MTYVNPALATLLGYTVDELIGQPVLALVADEFRDRVLRNMQRRLQGDTSLYRYEIKLTAKDGAEKWALLSGRAFRDAAGQVVFGTAVLTDITERRRVEERRHAREEARYRVLAESPTDIIARLTLDGVYLYVSPACQTLLGYTPDELIGRSGRELVHPDDLAVVRAFHKALLDETDPSTVAAYRLRRKDGTYAWFETSSCAVRDAQTGAFVEFQSASRDITARRQAEERYRALLDGAPDAIVISGAGGRIVLANSQVERLFGYRREELLGQSVELLLPEPLRAVHTRHRAAYVAAPRTRPMGQNLELQARRKDGSTFPVEISLSPLSSEGSLLVTAIIHDVTERKQAQDALTRVNADLEKASQAKSAFLAVMSHELRTPLNGVLGLTSLLLGTALDDRQRQYASGIQTSGEALLALVSDILDLSKIEAGHVVLEEEPVALRPLVEGVVETVTAQARAAELAVLAYIAPEVPEVLLGDPMRLRQVLTNLVGNAVKFTAQGAVVVRVRLVTAGDPTWLRFSVIDTGIGIAPEAQAHIFGAFTQADSSTARRYGGTGLGLAICTQLVGLMGGRIGMASAVGQGSIFTIIVPLRRADSASEAAPARAPLPVRALLVGGPAPLHSALRDQLADWGAMVTSTADARRALRLARVPAEGGQPYDVVLLSRPVGGLDGLELARQLREGALPAVVPLVLVTPSAVEERAAKRAGLTAQLLLPVRAAPFYATLTRLTARAVTGPGARLADPPRPQTHPPAEAGASGRVLVAEDNALNQLVAVGLLQSLGYAVEAVDNGQQAVAALQEGPFDLVLMDCHMPVLDGFAATAAIRRQEQAAGSGHHTPIVALTADALVGDAEKSVAAGMDDHLTKPVTLERLAAVVARWVKPHAERDSIVQAGHDVIQPAPGDRAPPDRTG
jgi:PAS domain S-box-containing protein